jgi:hypothetical protein
MNAYIYRAALICEACALQFIKNNPSVENTGDSDSYPQGPHAQGGGEADSPQHCNMGNECVDSIPSGNPDKFPNWGAFLENPLTSDGYRHVENVCRRNLNNGATGGVALEVWAPFYKVSLEPDDE